MASHEKATAEGVQPTVLASLDPSSEKSDADPLKDKALVGVVATETSTSGESAYDFTSPEFASIPELVRTVVDFEDDPSLPVLTFRSVLLSAIFCILGSVVSQIS